MLERRSSEGKACFRPFEPLPTAEAYTVLLHTERVRAHIYHLAGTTRYVLHVDVVGVLLCEDVEIICGALREFLVLGDEQHACCLFVDARGCDMLSMSAAKTTARLLSEMHEQLSAHLLASCICMATLGVVAQAVQKFVLLVYKPVRPLKLFQSLDLPLRDALDFYLATTPTTPP